MAEIYPEYIDHGATFATTGFCLDEGRAFLSGKPGLGVDIDVSALRRLTDNYHSTCLTMAEAAP
jgi:galactonate dehydratase